MPVQTSPRPTAPAAIAEWVPAAPFRAQFQALVEHSGLPWRVVALVAGLPPATALRLMRPPRRPQERIRLVDAERLYAVSPATLDALRTERVSARHPATIVRWFVRRGWTAGTIAAVSGLDVPLVEQLQRRALDTCSAVVALRLEAARAEVEAAAEARAARVGRMEPDVQHAA